MLSTVLLQMNFFKAFFVFSCKSTTNAVHFRLHILQGLFEHAANLFASLHARFLMYIPKLPHGFFKIQDFSN